MKLETLQQAINTGTKESAVLYQVLTFIVEKSSCPSAAGFEGPETFPDCGECIHCLAKKLLEDNS